MKGKFYFKESWFNAAKDLPEGLRREVYDSIITYAFTGTCPELKPMARIAFSVIKSDIDLDRETSAQFRELANKRWGKCDAYATAYASESDAHAEKEEAPKEKVAPKELPVEEKEEKVIDKSITKKKDERVEFVESLPEDWRAVVKSWLEYKAKRNDYYKTAQTLQAFYKNLLEYSGHNVSVAQRVIEQSMGNNWKGIFPLKNQSSTNNVKYQIPENVDEYQNQGGFYV